MLAAVVATRRNLRLVTPLGLIVLMVSGVSFRRGGVGRCVLVLRANGSNSSSDATHCLALAG